MPSIPFLLMPWRLQSPAHQQAWYWPNKPEYSISGIKRVNKWPVKLGYSVYITLTSCPQNSKLANGRYTYSPHKQFFHCTPNSMEFHFALIQVAVEGSLQNLAHDMIAMLLWHVQNFVVIWWHVMEAQWEKFPLNLNYDWKINSEVSPALFEWYIDPLKPG